jgi:hypothetical protein
MIIHGQNLVNKMRELSDAAMNRIWIVTPFIGSWHEVQKIIGTRWITQELLDVRLITDKRNEKLIDFQTYIKFQHKAEIKTLKGLHAKIYIFDSYYIITSANLTGTAFSRRHEVGIFEKIDDSIISLFNEWWDLSKKIDSTWVPLKSLKPGLDDNTVYTEGLNKLFNLPENNDKIDVFKDYHNSLNAYNHFKALYLNQIENNQVLEGLPILLEIDAFLNYLFHEHDNKPTKEYYKNTYRILNDSKREKELKKFLVQFTTWLRNNVDYKEYRIETLQFFQSKLAEQNIDKLTKNDINEIVSSMHCMNSLKLNKVKFLNPENNNTRKIKNAWKNLLYDNSEPILNRMEKCNNELLFFGKSSIQEFIAWYYPEKYPLINTNSSSGLKFFGYNVKTY